MERMTRRNVLASAALAIVTVTGADLALSHPMSAAASPDVKDQSRDDHGRRHRRHERHHHHDRHDDHDDDRNS
jgi:hypothetical protein